MVDYDSVFFNVAAFIGGLFVLEFGADKFVDHTAKIAARTRIPPTLIALLTAGAEWEELVVVIASISQHQSPLALGNILGSSISNILGAFSLGLIFSPTPITFDRSAKIYTGVLLGLTTFFSLFILFLQPLGRFGGILLIVLFGIYIASIAWAISRSLVSAPVDSDSDSDSDSSSDSDLDSDAESIPLKEKPVHAHKPLASSSPTEGRSRSTSLASQDLERGPEDTVQLDKDVFDDQLPLSTPEYQTPKPHKSKSIYKSVGHLILGLAALSLSSYILSHTLTSLSSPSALNLPTTTLGFTLLSLATTLPEKLVSILSASRSQSGIVVANTAGSNIFLLTLCAGVLFTSGDLASMVGTIKGWEVGVMWMCSVVLAAIVWGGGKRWMGWGMLGGYALFIAVEFWVGGGRGANPA